MCNDFYTVVHGKQQNSKSDEEFAVAQRLVRKNGNKDQSTPKQNSLN